MKLMYALILYTEPPTGTPTEPPARTPTEPPTGTPTEPPTGTPTEPPTGTPTEPPTGSPSAPSGVMVDGVDDTSVRVSWGAVDGADRYTVTFTKTKGDAQTGVCAGATHIARVSVDAPNTSASIGMGQMPAPGDRTMLRAYTTYSITVVAVNDVTGNSEGSEPVTVTTAQISMWYIYRRL